MPVSTTKTFVRPESTSSALSGLKTSPFSLFRPPRLGRPSEGQRASCSPGPPLSCSIYHHRKSRWSCFCMARRSQHVLCLHPSMPTRESTTYPPLSHSVGAWAVPTAANTKAISTNFILIFPMSHSTKLGSGLFWRGGPGARSRAQWLKDLYAKGIMPPAHAEQGGAWRMACTQVYGENQLVSHIRCRFTVGVSRVAWCSRILRGGTVTTARLEPLRH